MRLWPPREWGIRARVLFLAIAPVFLATLVLGGYLISVQLNDVERALQYRGQLLARYLAPASEFGLFSGSREQLEAAAMAAARQPEVYSVTIRSADDSLIVSAISPDFAQAVTDPPPADLLVFSEPVYRTGVDPSALGQEFLGPLPTQEVVGRVMVVMAPYGTGARQRQIFIASLLIITGVLAVSIGLAHRTARGVTKPVLHLHSIVARLKRGNLAARVTEEGGGELTQLGRGFNEMAEQLEKAQTHLERQVAKATDRLRATIKELEHKNRELEVAKQQALQAGHEKAQFLANMSHEIRTPMNAVVGFANLLARTLLDEEQAAYSGTIQQAGKQLVAIIDDILDFSKLEAGSLVPERIPFTTRMPLEEVVAMLRPSAEEKGLRLELQLAPGLPEHLLGDPARLRQILINLVNNAIKFTNSGHVHLKAGFDSGQLRISVSDTGIGISPSQQGRIFKAFSQADDSITRQFGGTGLGLAIVKRLVGLMGGEVRVESTPGAGSDFHVALPLQPADGAGLAPGSETDRALGSFPGARALVVEDNGFNRRLLSALLGKAQIEVAEAVSGHDALARLNGDRFDIVLMDIHMPGLDGYETTRRYRAAGGRTPVIALTADIFARKEKEAGTGDFDGWLLKPLDEGELWATLRRWLPSASKQPGTGPLAAGQEETGAADGRALPPELWTRLVAELARQAAGLREAFERGDHQTIRRHAHDLQGLTGYFTVPGLADTARQLSVCLKEGRDSAVAGCVDAVLASIESAIAAEADA